MFTARQEINVCVQFTLASCLKVGWDSSVGKATRYGLDGSGIEFRTRPDRPWDPPNLLYNGYRAFVACSKANVTFSCTFSCLQVIREAAQPQFLVPNFLCVPRRDTHVLRVSHILAITATIVAMFSVRYARRQKTQLPT